jgi:hypothetical protein
MRVTLKEAVQKERCRKGKADGITKRGAYWLACEPIVLRRAGGDGIGQSAPDITWSLEIRHFRDNSVVPTLHRSAWHQNGSYSGGGDRYFIREGLADVTTVEEAIANLKAGTSEEHCYHSSRYAEVRDALLALGLPEAAPSPDDAE